MFSFKIVVACLLSLGGPIGLIIAFLIINKYTQNFVLEPLARYMSLQKDEPSNYMYQKLSKIRLGIVILSVICNFYLTFFIELILIRLSCNFIQYIKAKEKLPKSKFAEDDYKIYDLYFSNYPKNTSLNITKEKLDVIKNKENIEKKSYSYEDVITGRNIKVNSNKKEKLKKEEFVTVEVPVKKHEKMNKTKEITISAENKFDFDKPVEPISISVNEIGEMDKVSQDAKSNAQENIELKPDEIRCEKCGEIMSKNKIVCLKCGTLVKIQNQKRI